MPNLEPIRQRYILNTTHAVGAAGRATRATKKMNFALREVNAAARLALRRAGAAVFAALGAIFFKATQLTVKFRKEMAEVSTLVDTATVSMGAMRKEVLSLHRTVPLALSDLTKGLYQTISAAVPAKNAIKFLGVAAKAAVAGVTNVSTAVDGMTSVLNAWALSTDDATRIADTFFVTVRDGKTTFAEMAKNIGTVAPMAAGMGATFEEVSAAIAAMTLQGLGTDKAAVAMRGFFNSLLRPTKEGADLARQLGLEWNEAAIRAQGFIPFMEQLREKTGGNSRAIALLVGNVRAANGVSALLKNGFDDLVRVMGDMETKTGAMDTAFDKMNRTADATWKLFKNNLSVALISLGDKILPAVNSALESMIDWFSKLSGTEVDRAIDKLRELGVEVDNLSKTQAVILKSKIIEEIERVKSISTGPVKTGFRTVPGVTRRRQGQTFTTEEFQEPFAKAVGRIDLTQFLDDPLAGVKAMQRELEVLDQQAQGLDAELAKATQEGLRLDKIEKGLDRDFLAGPSDLQLANIAEKERIKLLTDTIILEEDRLQRNKDLFEQILALNNVIAGVAPDTGTPPPVEDDGTLKVVDPNAIKEAREAFADYAREVALVAAKTDEQREALENLFEKQDAVKDLTESLAVISANLEDTRKGEKEAIDALATAYAELQELRADPDADEKEVKVAEEKVESALALHEAMQQQVLKERELLFIETRLLNTAKERLAAAVTGTKMRQLSLTTQAQMERLQNRLTNSTKKWDESIGHVLTTVADIARLFGSLGQDITSIVNGTIQLVSNLEKLKELEAISNAGEGISQSLKLASTLGAVGAGVAIGSSLLSIGGSLIGALGTNEEELARLNEELKDTQHAFRSAMEDFLRASTPAGSVTGEERTEILGLFDKLFLLTGRGVAPVFESDIKPILDDLVRLGALPDTIIDTLANSNFASASGASGNFLKFWLDELGIDDVRDTFLSLGAAGSSLAGVFRDVEIARLAFGLEGDALFDFMMERLNALDINEALKERLGDLALLDIESKAGQEALSRLINDLGESLVEGTGEFLDDSQFTSDDINDLLRSLIDFVSESEDDAISRSVQIARTITEIQASELIAIQEQALMTLEAIRDAVTNTIGKGATYNIDVTVPPDIDDVGRFILEQIENEIALKEAS